MREFPADLYRGYSLFHALPILRIGCIDSIRGTSLRGEKCEVPMGQALRPAGVTSHITI